jgi:hypothetical protein
LINAYGGTVMNVYKFLKIRKNVINGNVIPESTQDDWPFRSLVGGLAACICLSSCTTPLSEPVINKRNNPQGNVEVIPAPAPVPEVVKVWTSRPYTEPLKWKDNLSSGDLAKEAVDWMYMLEYQVWTGLKSASQATGGEMKTQLEELESVLTESIRVCGDKTGMGLDRLRNERKNIEEQLAEMPATGMYQRLRKSTQKVQEQIDRLTQLIPIQEKRFSDLQKQLLEIQVFYLDAQGMLGAEGAAAECRRQLKKYVEAWQPFLWLDSVTYTP